MRIIVAALLAAVPASAMAQQVSGSQAITILSDGKVLSASSLDGDAEKSMMSQIPEGPRRHEIFVLHNREIYLCILVGSADTGTPPYASCFGAAP